MEVQNVCNVIGVRLEFNKKLCRICQESFPDKDVESNPSETSLLNLLEKLRARVDGKTEYQEWTLDLEGETSAEECFTIGNVFRKLQIKTPLKDF